MVDASKDEVGEDARGKLRLVSFTRGPGGFRTPGARSREATRQSCGRLREDKERQAYLVPTMKSLGRQKSGRLRGDQGRYACWCRW